MRKIDVHGHWNGQSELLDEWVADEREKGIDRVVVFDIRAGLGDGDEDQDGVIGAAERYPDFVIPFFNVDWQTDDGKAVEARRAAGFVGAKLILPPAPYDDDRFFDLYEGLARNGMIALFHTAKGNLIKVMVTLNTRRPSEHRYRLFGTEGSAEWFSYEGFCRRLSRDREEREGWERIDIGSAAREDDTTTGHGGTDLKVARHFTEALLAGKPPPIDVYRGIEYSLPGIIANKSAELGGVPLAVPDLRREPFTGTTFWDTVALPEIEPEPEAG